MKSKKSGNEGNRIGVQTRRMAKLKEKTRITKHSEYLSNENSNEMKTTKHELKESVRKPHVLHLRW
jgi:RNA binding exosome subunit